MVYINNDIHFTSYIIEDTEYLILVTPDITRVDWAQVTHKFPLTKTEVVVDQRVLTVNVAIKHFYFDMKLEFDDASLASECKKMLDDSRHAHGERLRNSILEQLHSDLHK
jgi:hypothetical protein